MTPATIEATELAQRVDAVRRFNRLYTRRIGVLQQGYLHSPFSLTEVRVLYELAQRERATATELARELELDDGYVSRIVHGFVTRGLLERTRSARDGRESWLSLSQPGRTAFGALEQGARDQIGGLLGKMSEHNQERLVGAMRQISWLLGEPPGDGPGGYVLRQHQPGDMGWVVQRHGVLYAQEYGFDVQFEALVAEIVARFAQRFDPQRERCWIAERGGQNVGCVFLVKRTRRVAKLRLFLVEPEARGLGLGKRLVEECVRFARAADYHTIRLWTQSNLLAARHLYVQAGFRLIEEEAHHSFSQDLVAETWELGL